MSQLWRYTKTFLKVFLRRPLPGVTLIPILPDGKIVLVKRRDTDQWGLPGGLIDWGETIENAAKRELQEETGLELKQIERLAGVYSSLGRDPRMHSIAISVVINAAGQLQVSDQGEISQARAFSVDEIPFGHLSHDHDEQLANFLHHKSIIR